MKKLIITEEEKLQIKKLYNIITEQTDNKVCLKRYKRLLNDAVNWWKNWLNNSETEKKWNNLYYYKSSEINPEKHPYSFVKSFWISSLENIKIIPFDKNTKVLYDSENRQISTEVISVSTAAFYNSKPYSSDIFVNCDFSGLSDEEIKNQILIHEIQHMLNNVFPLNDMMDISYKYYTFQQPDNGYSATTEQDIVKEIGNDNFMGLKKLFRDKTLEIYNRYMKESEEWEKSLSDDPGYTCSNGEKLSNLYSIRALLKINPNQQITSQLLLPYLTYQKEDNINITSFLLCWSRRKFPPIDKYLNDFNALAIKDKGNSTAV